MTTLFFNEVEMKLPIGAEMPATMTKLTRKFSLIVALLLMLSACVTAPVAVTPPTPVPPKPPKIALVLGGGAVRGFAHIGVLKMLQSQGIVPDMVIGTSAGSVAGALYASGYSGYELQRIAFDLDKATVADVTLFGKGLLKGDALQNFINKAVGGKNIEDLKIPFACVATRLDTGEAVLFQRGNIAVAVRASSAVPGVFQPAIINGAEYVDGGLVSPVPVRYARQMGANFIIAVDVSSPPAKETSTGTMDILMRSYDIMGKSIRDLELPQADVLIRPDLSHVNSSELEGKHLAILEGEKAAEAQIPQIREKLRARMSAVAP
jgi:NTE family protein